MIDTKDLDFNMAFNRGASMRDLGMPLDAIITEDEDKEEWLKGWRHADAKTTAPIIWRLALGPAR